MGTSSSKHADNETELLDLSILVATLELIRSQLDAQETVLHELLSKLEKDANRVTHQQMRTKESQKQKRKSFTQITNRLSDNQFHRVFRMKKISFHKLCLLIETNVGKDVFKSEKHTTNYHSKTEAATNFRGGEISGEIRMAIFLRLLAGASYLDLFMLYDVSTKSVYNSFKKAIYWVNTTLKFRLVQALQEEDKYYFEQLSNSFGLDSQGEFMGCIGALDGLAIKIKRPTITEILKDPGAYYCRKGFYALNIQAICDRYKRILWISSRHIGTCHDSRAFKDTQLYDLLKDKAKFLSDQSLFIVGDSAYDLESFLLIPHEEPAPASPEDNYNYYHSNCRIRIECTFGELIMRFGLFWRALNMDIESAGDIISAASLLHNFIIDEREGVDTFVPTEDSSQETPSPSSQASDTLPQSPATLNDSSYVDQSYFENFSIQSVDESDTAQDFMGLFDQQSSHFEIAEPICTDNNEPRRGGRPTAESLASKDIGSAIREILTLHLQVQGKKRPEEKGFKYNHLGMVYMDH